MKGGEDINVIDFKWGQAALMLAAVRNDIDSVKLLLQAKNDLSTKQIMD